MRRKQTVVIALRLVQRAVGDCGMVTQAKYARIDHEVVKVISALNHSAIQRLCEKRVIQISMFDEKNIVEIIDGKNRYCLCKNPFMADKETATQEALLKKTTEELDYLTRNLVSSALTFSMRRRCLSSIVNFADRNVLAKSWASADPTMRAPNTSIFISSCSTPWRAE